MLGFILCTLSFFCTLSVHASEIINVRKWTATNGKGFEAKLLKVSDTAYKLKRKSDGRIFDIPVEKISEDDKKLVFEANQKLDLAKEECVKPYYDGRRFMGLTDPSEEFWHTAYVLGRELEIWNTIKTATNVSHKAEQQFATITVNSFKIENGKKSALLRGHLITIRLTCSSGYQFKQTKNGLALVTSSERLVKLVHEMRSALDRKITYSPHFRDTGNLRDCKEEDVGVDKTLVLTFQL